MPSSSGQSEAGAWSDPVVPCQGQRLRSAPTITPESTTIVPRWWRTSRWRISLTITTRPTQAHSPNQAM